MDCSSCFSMKSPGCDYIEKEDIQSAGQFTWFYLHHLSDGFSPGSVRAGPELASNPLTREIMFPHLHLPSLMISTSLFDILSQTRLG